jgi:hypothetical protein
MASKLNGIHEPTVTKWGCFDSVASCSILVHSQRMITRRSGTGTCRRVSVPRLRRNIGPELWKPFGSAAATQMRSGTAAQGKD